MPEYQSEIDTHSYRPTTPGTTPPRPVREVGVREFAQALYRLQPEKDAARLSLFNFLLYFCGPEEILAPSTLRSFVIQSLSFNYWQEHWPEFCAQIRHVLQSLLGEVGPQFEELLDPEALQILSVGGRQNWHQLITKFEKQRMPQGSGLKLIETKDTDKLILALIYHTDRSLSVHFYNDQFVIANGEIQPAWQGLGLEYDAGLNLKPRQFFKIPVATHTMARFSINETGCQGHILRGYTLQKYKELGGGYLGQFPLLFYPLKQYERHFINRQSDPVYIEAVQMLEHAIESQGADAQATQSALAHGEQIYEHIYNDDKLLLHLIGHLKKSLAIGTYL